MNAEIISIGTELLLGHILNTNTAFLSQKLAETGIDVYNTSVVGDNPRRLVESLKEALNRSDIVITTGGLGPTVDDITRDALAAALGKKPVLDRPTVAVMTERYAVRGRKMNPAGERQALVFEGATVLPNSVGAAPGQRLELPGGKLLFVLPGPPNEFNAILNEEIIPWLKERFPDARPRPVRIIRTQGIGESDIVTILERENFQPLDVDLGFYPAMGKVEIRLTADPAHEAQVSEAEQTLLGLLADFIDPES